MKLDQYNYFSKEANLEYMSNSQFGDFLKCESMAMAKLSGEYEEEKSVALICGSYVDAWNDGELAKFQEEHPELYSSKGVTAGELKSTYKDAEKAIEVIQADSLFMQSLSGEKQKIFTAELFGILWKVKIDSYFTRTKDQEGRIVDLKYLKSLYDKFWVRSDDGTGYYEHVFEYRGYYRQVALYCEIERLSEGRKENDYYEPFLAIVTKDSPPDKEIISFISKETGLEHFISNQLGVIEQSIERIKLVKSGKTTPRRCEHCEHCRSTKVLIGTKHYTAFNLY